MVLILRIPVGKLWVYLVNLVLVFADHPVLAFRSTLKRTHPA